MGDMKNRVISGPGPIVAQATRLRFSGKRRFAATPRLRTGKSAPPWLWLHCIMLLAVAICPLFADDLAANFAEANKLYVQGQYAEAASAYQKLVESGEVSAALYFNLGNAWFKSGAIGRAVVNYRLAEVLSPRDADLRANLQFARNRVSKDGPVQGKRWRAWLSWLTLNEWTVFAAASGWGWLGMLTLSQWRPGLKKALGRYTAAIGAVFVLASVGLGLKLHDYLATTSAVVVVSEATVRYGPLEESRSFYTLRDGAEVEVTDQQGQWLQVRDASRRTGWLRSDQVIVLKPVV
jgi:hypothetical protein